MAKIGEAAAERIGEAMHAAYREYLKGIGIEPKDKVFKEMPPEHRTITILMFQAGLDEYDKIVQEELLKEPDRFEQG